MVSEGRAWSQVTCCWGSVQKVIGGEQLEEDRTIKEVVAAYSEHTGFGVDIGRK